MKDNLSISVIIVTFNRADSLEETLASLVKQVRQPDEVVVVDNRSTDNTKEMALSFTDRLNIKYVYEGQRGIPYARNAGVRSATKDIVAFIDDDCIAHRNWLKHLEIPFIKDPHIGVVGGEVCHFKTGEGIVDEFFTRNMPEIPLE